MAKIARDMMANRMEMVMLNCVASWHQWSRLQSLARDDSYTVENVTLGNADRRAYLSLQRTFA